MDKRCAAVGDNKNPLPRSNSVFMGVERFNFYSPVVVLSFSDIPIIIVINGFPARCM